MFVRIRKSRLSQRRIVVVCHNVRRGDKVRQIPVKIFGHSSVDSEIAQFVVQARNWIDDFGAEWLRCNLTPKKIGGRGPSLKGELQQETIQAGVEDILGKLYEDLGFHKLLSSAQQPLLRKVLFTRTLAPGRDQRFNCELENQLSEAWPAIYRMFDDLVQDSDKVQQTILAAAQKTLGTKITPTVLKVANLPFELFDNKLEHFTTTQQVIVAAIQDELPVGLQCAVTPDTLQLPKSNAQVIGNLALGAKDYIVDVALQDLSSEHQAMVLDANKYTLVSNDPEINRFRVIDLGGRYLHVSYSERRAVEDREARERIIKKLRGLLYFRKPLKNLGPLARYLHPDAEHIDNDKVLADAKWDGLLGLVSNKKYNLEVFAAYNQFVAEKMFFSINKHNLKARPLYHFTAANIQAHVLLCYMELAMLKHISFKLQQANHAMSITRIMAAISDVEAKVLVKDNRKYRKVIVQTTDSEVIYQVLGLTDKLKLLPLVA